MIKEFDCVEFKQKIQEELWLEGGETLEGLKKILFEKQDNDMYKFFMERQEKDKLQTTV